MIAKPTEKRPLTEVEKQTLVKIFEECSLCLVRDALIDGGITDENFPQLYFDCWRQNIQAFKPRH
jgi:hypothetical protein